MGAAGVYIRKTGGSIEFGSLLHRCNNVGGDIERRRNLQASSSGGLAPVDDPGYPEVLLLLEPDAIGHPALLPQGERYFGWVRPSGCVDT
jgi:hypothetical protein